jgi:FG-GAP repeat
MKSKILFLFLVLTQTLTAQTFTQMPGTPFDGLYISSIAFSDVNGDGNDDVLITGQNSFGELIAKL